MRKYLLPTALAAVTAVAGCAPPPVVEVGGSPRVRLIVEDPQLVLPVSDLLRIEPGARLEPSLDDWRVEPAGAASPASEGGLRLASGRGRMVLETDAGPAWAAARRVEAVIPGVENGAVLLHWRSEGGASDGGGVRMARLPGPADRYRAEVDRHAGWVGADHVRIEVRTRPGSTPRVEAVETFVKRIDEDAFEAVAGTAVKMELGSDARNAFLAPAGESVERRIRVVAPCVLRFGYGVPAAIDRALEMRLELSAEGLDAVEVRDRIEPGSDRAGVWHDAVVDLGPFVGAEVLVELRFDAGGDADPARSWGLWANPEAIATAVEPPGPGLVLISVDALRADRLSLYGHPAPTSPAIDAWARERGFVFEQAVAAAPWTLPAHVSMLTGFGALRHGVNHDVGDARRLTGASSTAELVMLAEVLRTTGYATAAITGGAYVDARYGLAQGFDRYRSWPDRSRDADELRQGVDRGLAWIADRTGEPFFLFLHTYAVHDPYRPWGENLGRVAPEVGSFDGSVAITSDIDPEDGFRQRNRFVVRHAAEQQTVDEADLRTVRALYDAGIRHADAEIARFLAGLDALGVADRTAVVLTSDHGESLGEHGRVGHVDLTDEVLRVPLVIAAPAMRGAGGRFADQVRQVDLLPTVLELLGIEPLQGVDGRSLAPALDGRSAPVAAEATSYSSAANRGVSIRTADGVKYILNNTAWLELAGREQLYDLVADPSEGRDLAPSDPRRGPLHRRAVELLDERAAGLRLEVRNAGRKPVTARLSGAMVQGVGTVTLGLDRPWVSWADRGEADLEAPPGAAYTLVFEKVMGRSLRLSGSVVDPSGTDEAFDWEVDVRELDGGRWLVLRDARWRESDEPPAAGSTAFGLSWRGPAAIRSSSPADADADLREQLRALGYVQ